MITKQVAVATLFVLLPLGDCVADNNPVNWVPSTQLYPPGFTADRDDLSRRKQQRDSPPWLRAIAKFQNIHCSATLVSPRTPLRRDLVLTAKHCLPADPTNLTLRWRDADGYPIVLAVRRLLAQGISVEHDWALLQMVGDVDARVADPLQPAGSFAESVGWGIAGYSADLTTELGNAGRDLTYDLGCQHAEPAHMPDWYRATGCYAYPGASGGAYVSWSETSQHVEILGPISSVRPGTNYIPKRSLWADELQKVAELADE